MKVNILFIIPLIAIINILLISRNNKIKLDNIALVWSLLQTLIFVILYLIYDNRYEFQFIINTEWLNNQNSILSWSNITFSCDGLSLFFIGLSIILLPICILISRIAIDYLKKEFLISLFFILIFLMGVFTIMDLLGFYILFEAILIPMFLIIGIWGSREEKVKAAYYFFFYTLIGSLLMLLSIFKIYSITGTTNYHTLLTVELPNNLQFWLFIGFFSSLAVKIPMFPVHIWLPQAHVEAPISGSVLLAGILLKLGGYGFLRFTIPVFPLASEFFSPLIVSLSILAIVFGAFTTCRQTDIKRLIAYSSVSHMGLVTLALFVHNLEGLIASTLMMLAHGLISSGLFMTSATLYTRHHTRAIRYFRGLTSVMPVLSTVTLILILGNISFPMTLNFIAEFFSLVVAFNYSYISGIGICIGIILGTIYSFYLYNRIYFGSLNKSLILTRDLCSYEFNSFLPLIILTIILGILPNLLIDILLCSSLINISL